MAQITLDYDNFTALPLSAGTVQNISPAATVELTDNPAQNTGLVLEPGKIFSWNKDTALYARALWKGSPGECKISAVPFTEAGGGGGSGGTDGAAAYKQIVKIGVTASELAPKDISIPVHKLTGDEGRPPAAVYQAQNDDSAQTVVVTKFDNSDADDFTIQDNTVNGVTYPAYDTAGNAKYVEFDGTMHLKTEYEEEMNEPKALGSGYCAMSERFDARQWQDIESVEVVNHTLEYFSFDSGADLNGYDVYGGAEIATDKYKTGTGSLYVPLGGYLQSPNTITGFGLGTGEFTIDLWAWYSSAGMESNPFIFEISSDNASVNNGALIAYNRNDKRLEGRINLCVGTGNDYKIITAAPSDFLDRWVHLALVRGAGKLFLFVDGISQGSVDMPDSEIWPAERIYIGRHPAYNFDTNTRFNGWIDDFRITKKALWTGDFTPPVKYLA